MDSFLKWTELIYNLSFIIFTLILVVYTVKSYNNQKKQPYKLIARINYHFTKKKDGMIPVILDIINYGDFVAKKVKIQFGIKQGQTKELDCINFIASKENFEFYLGSLLEKQLMLFNGKQLLIKNPLDYDYFEISIENNIVTLIIRGVEKV